MDISVLDVGWLPDRGGGLKEVLAKTQNRVEAVAKAGLRHRHLQRRVSTW